MGAGSSSEDELTTAELKNYLKALSDMGVFHVALGGGEAFNRRDFGDIVAYCREIGLVPNLTTNGQNIGDKEIAICKMMGQVNISLDGTGPRYGINGRSGEFEKADAAISSLKKADVPTGINCVVSGKNYPFIHEVIRYASGKDLNEIEFLRFKPSGRGRNKYHEYAMTQRMIRDFYPSLLSLLQKYELEIKIDCSFIPALVYHHPPRDELEKLAVSGCDGGNMLLSVRSNGEFSGCSFVTNDEHVSEIEERWDTSEHLGRFRKLTSQAREPCRSCEYLTICKCGCRAAAIHLTGDFFAPDPECPVVYDYVNGS
jgi:radical SAM protein with 4Fe4S-binding SPASM domain